MFGVDCMFDIFKFNETNYTTKQMPYYTYLVSNFKYFSITVLTKQKLVKNNRYCLPRQPPS